MVILTPITINNHFNNANYVTKVDHLCSERHTFNFLLKKVDFRATTYTPTSEVAFPVTVTVPVSGNTGSVTLSGIPYGTTYSVAEDSTSQAGTTSVASVYSQTTAANRKIGVAGTHSFTVTNNSPSATEVTVQKTGGNGLDGAELELWYKETVLPATNSFNDPEIIPSQKMNGLTVSGTGDSEGVPGPAVSTSTSDTYTYSTTYAEPPVPSSSDTEWILPRSDSDYIYFRDYNVGQYTADKDAVSFSNTTGKRSWRQTNFAQKEAATTTDPKTHNRNEELGFADESDNTKHYWFAAEFYGTGKQTVKYAMWERFVDDFTYTPYGGSTNETVKTVVWKIQPPDGYDQVRFILIDGDNWIRSTEKFNFELGEIYHKTNWGGTYSAKYGGSYYDVPVNEEDYLIWAPEDTSVTDNRNSDIEQPRKYEPTDQKVIFYCNSENVWHNIHIEFFTKDDTNGTVTEGDHKYNRIEGQPFPGYMMEPYAYAESNYRLRKNGIEQYLTYELTIPKGATHFRINNGVDNSTVKGSFSGNGSGGQSPYAYRTDIHPLYQSDSSTTNTGNGTKNYGNYFVLNTTADATTPCSNSSAVTLQDGLNTITTLSGENTSKTYTQKDVESDYDYIYFKKPTGWNDHVYAYFYGGGNLRDDNWQRACYSAWPGVAAAGTEYVEYDANGTLSNTYHSNTYTYTTTGNTYNGKNTDGSANLTSPETTFTSNGKTIYKFRVPKGDRTNYSKVVFNDGLKGMGGGNETDAILYQKGHIYDKNGNEKKHYESSPTQTYTQSVVVENEGESNETSTPEYLYIKNTAGWNDLHITFYNKNGGQVLQSGVGYIMDYAGKVDATEYFRVPLPAASTGAVKFSVNNGIGSSNKTDQFEITRLDATAAPKSTGASTDRFVYELKADKTLSRVGITTNLVTQQHASVTPQTETTGYTVRHTASGKDDTLYICDSASTPWNVDIGNISVTFYKADGTSAGSGVMMKTNADSDGHVWYTKKIPSDAASFVVSYSKNSGANIYTTPSYPIYPATAGSDGNYTTSGNMFYKTESATTLSMTNAQQQGTSYANDETYEQRGDYLYLVSSSEQSDLTVSFYGAGDTLIKSGVTAKYINQDSSNRYWYKVSIPTGAKQFTANVGGTDTPKADIYELKAGYSPYEKDYTVGDMQYQLNGASAPTILYPIFTEDKEYTGKIGNQQLSTRSIPSNVDESQIQNYAAGAAATSPTSTAGDPSGSTVLYNTSKDNVKYTWTEGTAGDGMLRFVVPSGWTTPPTAEFYNGSNTTAVTSTVMTIDSGTTYKVTVPDTSTYTYDKVVFVCGSNKTDKITLLGDHGKNYTCQKVTNSSYTVNSGYVGYDNRRFNWSTVYAHFWGGSGATEWPGIEMTK